MRQTSRVAVVGGGVVGLSTTAALLDAGAEVRLYERDAPGLAQSKGRTRVFRLAHGDARLVELATRAERLWRGWERRFGRRLVGDEGLIVTGDETVKAWSEAMAEAGARHSVVSIREAMAHVPMACPAGSAALFDPHAGPTRARRTIECLVALCAGVLWHDEVIEVFQNGAICRVETASGSWECDEVIITAGIATGRLAAAAGIGAELPVIHDSRFTYAIRGEYWERPLACWFDTSGAYGGCTSYGQRVGSTRYYAVGVGWGDVTGLTPDEESGRHQEVAADYLRQAYPGLDPIPVDEIRCSYAGDGVGEDGDGFVAKRNAGIAALYGNNLFKFAPLLGQLLCQTAMTGELPAELTLYQ